MPYILAIGGFLLGGTCLIMSFRSSAEKAFGFGVLAFIIIVMTIAASVGFARRSQQLLTAPFKVDSDK